MQKIIGAVLVSLLLISPVFAAVNRPADFRIVTNPPAANPDYSGVAPFAVFFEAPGALVDSATVGEIKPYHDYLYEWNFDDPDSGAWGTNGKSRNAARGPIAAHVYETPGTYTVTVDKRDGSGVIKTDSFVVYVQDPDTVFSGSSTICISDSVHNDFNGCPSGANHVTTDSIAEIKNYIVSGKRVLLGRGSSWTFSTSIGDISQGTVGPIIVGAYGTCRNPNEQGICDNAPLIIITAPNITVFSLRNNSNIRFMDIAFTSDGTDTNVSSAVGGVTNLKNILLLRLKAYDFDGVAFGNGHWREAEGQEPKGYAIVSCNVDRMNSYNYYTGSEELIFMGNVGLQSNTTHIARIWWGYKAVISNNLLSGASFMNTNGRHALKFHGPKESQIGSYATSGGVGLPFRTKFALVSDNIIGSSGPWPMAIGPQDAGSEENLSDILIERNKVLGDYGNVNSTPVSVGMTLEGRYFSARNNVIDGTSERNSIIGIYIGRRGVEWTPFGNRVYNNTIYRSNSAVNGATGISVHADANQTIIRNNLVSFPNESLETLIDDHSGSVTASNNVLTDTPHLADPNNPDPLSRDFSITSNSAIAINRGTPVPVYEDFDGDYRSGSFEVGAYKY